jgi:hypothetical protein
VNYKYVSAARSGALIDYSDPQPEMFNKYDIALGLSKMCRFNGHIDGFYSVAQHSIMVAAHLPHELRPYGLLHDASEGYMADIVRPAKNKIGKAYYDVEETLMAAIAHRFGLDPNLFKHVLVVEADNRALLTERQFLISNWDQNEGLKAAWASLDAMYQPFDDVLEMHPMEWREAYASFLAVFNHLI